MSVMNRNRSFVFGQISADFFGQINRVAKKEKRASLSSLFQIYSPRRTRPTYAQTLRNHS